MSHLFVINDDPIKVEHLGWITREYNSEVLLIEIVQTTYRHPDAPDDAHVQQVEERIHKRVDKLRGQSTDPHIFLLKHMQCTVDKLER